MAYKETTGIGDGDTVGVRIFRGTGEVEELSIKAEQKTSTGNPLEAQLMLAGKLEGQTLMDWQIAIWQMLMNAVGHKMLGVEKKKFLFHVRLDLVEGDPICQKCVCNAPTICQHDKKTNICNEFVPQKDAIPHLWQWMMQARILPHE